MSAKILSIIVPAYNMEKYLPKCLGSLVVVPELMDMLEVLVVNDGSKDRTSEIAHEFARKWPQTFVVIDKANGNYGSCVNAALPKTTGKYVKMLDADDSYDTENFMLYMRFLESVDVDLIVSDFDYVDESGMTKDGDVYGLTEGVFDFRTVPAQFCSKAQMQAVAYRVVNLRRIDYVQTEGISYTDQEWMFRPMGTVSKAAYFHRVVYKYLCGRDGQTIDISVRRKNRWMVQKITSGLVDVYGKDASSDTEAGARYLKNRLLEQLHVAYSLCLLEPIRYERMTDLQRLDECLAVNHHEIFLEMEKFVSRNVFRFAFVKAWRRTGSDVSLPFIVYKLACRLRRAVRRVCA